MKEGDLVKVNNSTEVENCWEIDHIINFPNDNGIEIYECFNINDDKKELFSFYEEELTKIN